MLFEHVEPPRAVVVPTLRPYQQRSVEEVRELLRGGARRVLVVAPTGAGKTVMFARLVCGAVAKQKRVLVLAHRGELLEQTWEKVLAAGVPRSELSMLWANDKRYNPRALATIASVQTLVRRTSEPFDLVIIDEAHRALGASYAAIIDRNPNARVVGFTATPWRLDGQGLARMFDRSVVVATVPELIEQGFLCRPVVYSHPHKPDLSNVKLNAAGDYDEASLAAAVDTTVLLGNVVEHWQRLACGARTIAFAVNVQHSKNIVAAFKAAGVPAAHVDGETPASERAAILARLASGDVRVVSNCALFIEGFDCPAVKCVALLRPTKSRMLYMQSVGRGMRPDPAFPELRSCLVLDHAGCAHEHGLPQDPQDYSLEQGKRRRNAAALAPIKTCEQCYAVNPAAATVCEACGAPFPKKENTLAEKDGELARLEESEARSRALVERQAKKLRGSIQKLAEATDASRGWKPGETNRLLHGHFGSRREMSLSTLQSVLSFLSNDFPKKYPPKQPATEAPPPSLPAAEEFGEVEL